MGSNCFYLCFMISSCCLGTYLGVAKTISTFEILKKLHDGWVDVRADGDFLPSLIFFIFKYDKQFELIPKMCLKVAYAL